MMTNIQFGVQVGINLLNNVKFNVRLIDIFHQKKGFSNSFIGFADLTFSNALDAQHTKVDEFTTASIVKESNATMSSRNVSTEGI